MNPIAIIQNVMARNNLALNNPTMQNAMQMMNNNDVQGLQTLAENLCKSKGVKLSDVQSQVMKQFGMK